MIGENQVIRKLSEVFVSEAKANPSAESVTEKEIRKVSEEKREEKHTSKVIELSSVKVKKKSEEEKVKS